jgi:hypothetical protein
LVIQGIFGFQGNATNPSYNLWSGGTTAWGVTTLHFNTWNVNPSSPAPNTLFVTNDAGSNLFDPPHNKGNSFIPSNWYGSGTASGAGLNVSGTPIIPACEKRYFSPTGLLLRSAATHTDDYANMSKPLNWIAQKSIFTLMTMDSSVADSSATLAKFYAMAQNSRYPWLADIENAIITGNYANATSLLADDIHAHIDTATDSATGVVMVDGIEADNIVSNYINLYKIFLKYKDTLMNGDDSLQVVAMANLCPNTDGNVVYQARSFYRTLFEDDTTVFNDNCGLDSEAMETSNRAAPTSPLAEANGNQAYKLFPNPNDGSFMLRQNIAEATLVSMTVKDVLGRSVFTQEVQFSNSTAQLHLSNLPAGVYLLQIADSNRKVSNFKFVIQK